MKCQWCGKEFPHKKGRFCGTCKSPHQLRIAALESERDALKELVCSTTLQRNELFQDRQNREDEIEILRGEIKALNTQIDIEVCANIVHSQRAEDAEAKLSRYEDAFMKQPPYSCVPCKHYEIHTDTPPCSGCRDHDKFEPKLIEKSAFRKMLEDSGHPFENEEEHMTPEPLPKGYFGHEDGCDCAACDDIAMRNERISLVSNSEAATTIADLRAKYDIEARRGDRLSELLKKQTRLNAQILTQIGAGKEDLAEFIARHDRYQSALHIIAYMGISGLSWQYDFEKCVNIAKEALEI